MANSFILFVTFLLLLIHHDMSHLKAYHGFYLDERNVSANFNFRISMLQKAEDQIWFEL